MTSKKPLGLSRGLSSLLGDMNQIEEVSGSSIGEILVSDITENPNQPRTDFDGEEMQYLKDSIAKMGVIQPITVREIGDHKYEIIAGERRWRASKMAGKTTIPAYIVKVSDAESAEWALVENTHRADLNPIEIALSYKNLIDKFDYTAEELSEKVGKNRSTVANFIRLLSLPSKIQLGVQDKKITNGHARALLGLDSEEKQLEIFDKIIKDELSVRAVENLVKQEKEGVSNKKKPNKQKEPLSEEYVALVEKLKSAFNSKVSFSRNDKGKGNITIPFSSDDELLTIMEVFDSIIDNKHGN